MRKSVLTLFIIIALGGIAYADNPVPAMRPAAADVPSEVKSDESEYMPGVYKQHEDVKVEEEDARNPQLPTKDEVEKANSTNDSEEEYEEYEEEEDSNGDTSLEDALDGASNPVNDAAKENVQNGNYTPDKKVKEKTENTKNKINKAKQETKDSVKSSKDAVNNAAEAAAEAVSTTKKVKKAKKQKKQKTPKPKYGKYKDVESDLYIQEWEEELKNINPENGMKIVPDGESASQEEEKEKQKTYTQDDYEQAYRDMQVPTFSFVHGVDPDQYYDMKDTTWSPYPLLRLNSPLYFKTMTIEPGYYLLTPRQYKDDWYILFKEAGTVKYIVPAFEKKFTPANYYRDNLKELDMTRSARWQVKFLNAWGKYIRKSKRRPEIKCNIELTDLDNNFVLIELYYGAHKYSTIFRMEKY